MNNGLLSIFGFVSAVLVGVCAFSLVGVGSDFNLSESNYRNDINAVKQSRLEAEREKHKVEQITIKKYSSNSETNPADSLYNTVVNYDCKAKPYEVYYGDDKKAYMQDGNVIFETKDKTYIIDLPYGFKINDFDYAFIDDNVIIMPSAKYFYCMGH